MKEEEEKQGSRGIKTSLTPPSLSPCLQPYDKQTPHREKQDRVRLTQTDPTNDKAIYKTMNDSISDITMWIGNHMYLSMHP